MTDELKKDVALFIDWENIKASLDERGLKPNMTALRETAENFGRLVVAKAYADWQNEWHQNDPQNLYSAGIEPVYVPTKLGGASGLTNQRRKNSVDVKLTADCIETYHRYQSVQTFVLVSGDGDFVHVVNTLRPYGKEVIAIGVSWSTSLRLSQSVDRLLYYDRDVDRIEFHAPPPLPELPAISSDLEQAFTAVVTIIKESRLEGRALVNWIKQEIEQRYPKFDPQRLGFDKFTTFMQAAEKRGLLKIVTVGLVDWAYLPHVEVTAPGGAPPPPVMIKQIDPAVWERFIKVADAVEKGNLFVAFTLLVDTMMTARVFPEQSTEQVRLAINDAIEEGVFLRVTRAGRDKVTGEPFPLRTLVLNREHPMVVNVLGPPSVRSVGSIVEMAGATGQPAEVKREA
jgi:uncharacterized LabA/DUF88 family protein